jgi:three-Cys-motif partner protein
MVVSLADYTDREQAYVKHVLLDSYLERLVHKVASRYDHVAYVDGFAGPWQSANERFEDTSFGIALDALRSAKATWKQHGRDVRMSAFLVEKNKTAYSRLAQVPAKYPDLTVKPHCADFLEVVPSILEEIPPGAFAFFLIDPKGWGVPHSNMSPETMYNVHSVPLEHINDSLQAINEPWRARIFDDQFEFFLLG